MPQYLIHKNGAYNFWSTVVDAPCYESALTLEDVREIVKTEYGNDGLRLLDARLERAHRDGCSAFDMDLEDCIAGNRAGPDETEMPFDEVIARYLTLQECACGKQTCSQCGEDPAAHAGAPTRS
jgi:hypothetical protein